VASDAPCRSAAPTVGSPSHAGSPFRPSFVGLGRHHRSARTARPRACLRRGTVRPGTSSIGMAHDLATAVDDLAQTGSSALSSSGTCSRAAMGSTAVRRRGSPPHATPARSRTPCGARARWAGRMLLTDFCNLPLTRAPACIARLPRWPPLAQLPRPMERTPADGSGHGALDGAPRASTDAYTPSRKRGDEHPRILAGSRSGEPSKGALPSAALCSADEA